MIRCMGTPKAEKFLHKCDTCLYYPKTVLQEDKAAAWIDTRGIEYPCAAYVKEDGSFSRSENKKATKPFTEVTRVTKEAMDE